MTTKQYNELKGDVTSLRARINTLVDELSTVKGELKHFKGIVAKDITLLENSKKDRNN
jgi:predicted  nucleic acid-binding Zn-ribbon protein|tara:strand:- start:1706 stop:1879 length:174 start_codon:yes stop_codon:yes gene_type:complete